MKYRFFVPTPETLEELKKIYKELVVKHHPDRGGSHESMKQVNIEYDELFPKLKDVHKTKDGEKYTAKQPTAETPEHFKDLISELMRMDGITIEIIGCFCWVTGETKPHKDRLKSLKFQWHTKKVAWYLKPEDYKRQSRREYGLDEIRRMYGTSGKMDSNGSKTAKLEEATA